LILASVIPFVHVSAAPRLAPFNFVSKALLNVSSSQSGRWLEPLELAYGAAFLFGMARLLWRLARLRGINSSNASTPLSFGILAPRIVMPERFGREAPEAARRAAWAHERAHLARHDFTVNLALEALTLPLWFHPALWWMKRRLARVRELACDAQAAGTFEDPREYVNGLLEAAEFLTRQGALGPALGLFDANFFEERIMHLTEQHNWIPRRLARLMAAVAVAGLIGASTATVLFAVNVDDEKTVYKIGGDVLPPKVLTKVDPKYPKKARKAKLNGTVVLSLIITEAGTPQDIKVKKSLEPSLDRAAIEAVTKWRFQPSTKAGSPVAVNATIEVNFRLL
jgi:TonB family protein